MFKFIIVTVILIGAAFGIEPIRAKITPPLVPLFEMMGPVGDKLSNPAKRMAARNEAGMILRKISEEYQLKRTLPSPLGFQTWIKLNVRAGIKAAGLDPWGLPYYFIRENRQITVGSNGPDKTRGSDDDVRVSVPF